ncbi:hypothetical protein ACLOJK_032321 [Asimina triloba]
MTAAHFGISPCSRPRRYLAHASPPPAAVPVPAPHRRPYFFLFLPPYFPCSASDPIPPSLFLPLGELSILDLPDLVLECILGKLSPVGLCSMAAMRRSLRERCWNDHLWERHMREKWSRAVGPAAHREWQWFTAVRGDPGVLDGGNSKGLIGYLSCMWPISWLRSKFDWGRKPKSSLPVDSMISWYLALDNGKFWFPAQVYNREFRIDIPSCFACKSGQENMKVYHLRSDSSAHVVHEEMAVFGHSQCRPGKEIERLGRSVPSLSSLQGLSMENGDQSRGFLSCSPSNRVLDRLRGRQDAPVEGQEEIDTVQHHRPAFMHDTIRA